jgi:hypothetical protein
MSNKALNDRIRNDFEYHRPSQMRQDLMAGLRMKFLQLADILVAAVPEGRELSLALTNLEQAQFWANAGIARAPEE